MSSATIPVYEMMPAEGTNRFSFHNLGGLDTSYDPSGVSVVCLSYDDRDEEPTIGNTLMRSLRGEISENMEIGHAPNYLGTQPNLVRLVRNHAAFAEKEKNKHASWRTVTRATPEPHSGYHAMPLVGGSGAAVGAIGGEPLVVAGGIALAAAGIGGAEYGRRKALRKAQEYLDALGNNQDYQFWLGLMSAPAQNVDVEVVPDAQSFMRETLREINEIRFHAPDPSDMNAELRRLYDNHWAARSQTLTDPAGV